MEKALFGKSLKGNFYNYCPSMRFDGKKLHVWYCTNKISGNITDHIGYRTATQTHGQWRFSSEKIVLSPTPRTWDSRHTCDPSVIKGKFVLGKKVFSYLMVYLGCVTNDCKDNETGIALSERIEGPWIKYSANPLIPYIDSKDYPGPHVYWGYGQPCVVSVDKLGQVIIFYNVGIGETFTRAELWDLSDLMRPRKIRDVRLSDEGYVNLLGQADVIGNADFAFDEKTHAFYAVGDMRVRGDDQPTYISNALPLLKAQLSASESFPMATLFEGGIHWDTLFVVDSAVSGHEKNHNPGILTDLYGWLKDPREVFIAYTVSDLNKMHPRRKGIWQSLHTYRIFGQKVEVKGKGL